MLNHRASILAAEAARLAGAPSYTMEEVDAMMEELFNAGEN